MRPPDELPGLDHYRRALERGLPRWDMRSAKLRARQRARQRAKAPPPPLPAAFALAAAGGTPEEIARKLVAEAAMRFGLESDFMTATSKRGLHSRVRRAVVVALAAAQPGLPRKAIARLLRIDPTCVRQFLKGVR